MGEAKLNRKLNLVVNIDSEHGPLYVFSTPVARSVFEANFMVMCRAFAAIYANGLGPFAGPRAAALIIKQQAAEIGEPAQGEALLAEIRRLTNVLAPKFDNGSGGYEVVMWDEALKRELIDEDQAAEAEAAICFFTLSLRAGSTRQAEASVTGLKMMFAAQTTSSTLSDYMRSLPTLTKDEDTGPREIPSPEISLSSIPH
jgi:hypothetical protein